MQVIKCDVVFDVVCRSVACMRLGIVQEACIIFRGGVFNESLEMPALSVGYILA